jgi:hypothetical protein
MVSNGERSFLRIDALLTSPRAIRWERDLIRDIFTIFTASLLTALQAKWYLALTAREHQT